MSNYKLVYSTDPSIKDDNPVRKKSSVAQSEQQIRIHLDRKGGGKLLTVIKGFKEPDHILKLLAKDIKKKCASGGSMKNNEIIIQGNKRDIIKTFLELKGYKPKLSGG